MRDLASEENWHQPLVIAALCFVAAFAYRFSQVGGFANDHFMHLAWSNQFLAGEIPIGNFVDPGMPFTYLLSALALMLFGPTMLGETLLSVGGLSAAAALTFLLAAQLSRSVLLGISLAALQVILAPRLYAYPRLLVPIVALWVFWYYARNPRRSRVVLVSGWTVVAFLLRHDYGFIVGVAGLCLLVAVHHGDRRGLLARVGEYGVFGFVLLTPFLVFVQNQGGIVPYFRGGVAFAEGDQAVGASRRQLSRPRFALGPRMSFEVGILWADGLDGVTRAALEGRFGLLNSRPADGGRFHYDLVDISVENVASLVHDERVADTDRIERTTTTVPSAGWLTSLSWYLSDRGFGGPLRVLHRDNAIAWLYYLFLLTPVIVAAVLVAEQRWPIDRGWRAGEMPLVIAGVSLCALANYVFLRNPPGARIPDVSVVAPILILWIVWRLRTRLAVCELDMGRRITRPVRLCLATVTVLVGTTTMLSAAALGGFERDWANRWQVVRNTLSTVEDLRHTPQIDVWSPSNPALKEATRYIRDCTAPSDRVMVTWFGPEVYFYAERLFAAGQSFFYPGFFVTEEDQRRALSRLAAESVPIVLTHAERYQNFFISEYPLIAEHVEQEFPLAGEFGGDGAARIGVRTNRRRPPVRNDPVSGLPCYR
jgi:hypothetical protein